MKKIVLSLALATILSGCITKEGIRLFSIYPTKEDIADFNRRNVVSPSIFLPMQHQGMATTSLIPDTNGARIIIVGNVMALTPFDEPTLNQRYEAYLKRVMEASDPPEKPTFAKQWYLTTSAGETPVIISGITGIYHRFYKMEVPKDLVRQISFASAFGAAMFGTSGDLVAAELSSIGGWVTHVLCSEKDRDFSDCEARYRRGIYQGVDGREIDSLFKVKNGGAVIDTRTYKKKKSKTAGGVDSPAL